MKKLLIFFVLSILCSGLFGQTPAEPWRTKIAPEIRAALDRSEAADVLVVFKEKADLGTTKTLKTKSEKAHFVFKRLQETAARSQQNALKILSENGMSANTLFLVNALAVEKADASLLQKLAELPEIEAITADPWVEFGGTMETANASNTASDRNGIEWGIAKIQAPEVWSLGYTGQGITVGGADTGYDWGHPAIQRKYRGWTGDSSTSQHNYNWHDAIHELNPLNTDTLGNIGTNPCGLDLTQPCDDLNHGTHTMGTMTGSDADNLIGVAPDAKWVGCRNMERGWGKPSSYIECFQWFLAPTDLGGQNPNPDSAPQVVNNSWYCSEEEGCTDLTVNELLHDAVINLKTSGVVVVVSNGNFGPNCASTYGPPAYFEESFSVGSTRSDNFISGFSSRGPVLIDDSNRMKPNVSAPGEDVRSCIRDGKYANFSGTSMAGPHVVGLVALVLSANPALAGHVDDIEDIVEQTAIYFADTLDCGENSLGTARPNHAYGWGRVDALGAVQVALQWHPAVSTDSPVLLGATVSPNPLHEATIFNLENLSGESFLEIFNAEGKQVFAKKWLAQNRETLRISFENQSVGVYFWKLKSGNGVASGKLVRE
ncbi:MAG: S8 family peptidase [Phycisphaerae bacterium]|nr:S8 family peptidase [Saprospiraceae bacterium]